MRTALKGTVSMFSTACGPSGSSHSIRGGDCSNLIVVPFGRLVRDGVVPVVVPDTGGPIDQHHTRPAMGVDWFLLAGRNDDFDDANTVVLEEYVV
jgi:hypothetical protein